MIAGLEMILSGTVARMSCLKPVFGTVPMVLAAFLWMTGLTACSPSGSSSQNGSAASAGKNAASGAQFKEELPKGNTSDSFKKPRRLTSEEVEAKSGARLEWNRKTLVEVYREKGVKDPRWDKDVLRGLEIFAEMRVGSGLTGEVQEQLNEELRTATSRAWRAGCRDAMLAYLRARSHEGKADEGLGTPLEIVEAKLKSGEELLKSPYPAIRKAYGQLRAAQQLTAYVRATENTGAYRAERIPVLFMDATRLLKEALEEPGMPEQEVVEVCNDLIHAPTTRSGLAIRILSELIGPLQKNYSASGTAQFIKGDFYVDYAWQARGNGWSDDVSAEGWRLFESRIQVASESLNDSWEANPSDVRVATRMISVELGQGVGRKRMERWFNNAMELDTNAYRACSAKVAYLEPKWHGNPKAVLQFGRECVESKVWGGEVPYALVLGHERLAAYANLKGQKDYWEDPEVWKDVKAGFDRLFDGRPGMQGYHHNYALMAYRCGQWDVFEREIKSFTTGTNHSYFGGVAQFDAMIKEASKKREAMGQRP